MRARDQSSHGHNWVLAAKTFWLSDLGFMVKRVIKSAKKCILTHSREVRAWYHLFCQLIDNLNVLAVILASRVWSWASQCPTCSQRKEYCEISFHAVSVKCNPPDSPIQLTSLQLATQIKCNINKEAWHENSRRFNPPQFCIWLWVRALSRGWMQNCAIVTEDLTTMPSGGRWEQEFCVPSCKQGLSHNWEVALW